MIVWVLAGAQCCKFVQNHWNWKGEIHVWFLLMLVGGELLASVLSFSMAAYLLYNVKSLYIELLCAPCRVQWPVFLLSDDITRNVGGGSIATPEVLVSQTDSLPPPFRAVDTGGVFQGK